MQDSNLLNVYFDLVEPDISQYKAVEIHGVRDQNSYQQTDDTDCFVDDVDPQFFSIYVLHEDGTYLVCGDSGLFKLNGLRQAAMDFSQGHGLVYQDFSTVRRVIARFQPQAWIRDCAVDIDGQCDLDVTDRLLQMPLNTIISLEDDEYVSDELVHGLTGHVGPHHAEVKDSILEFFGVGKLADVTEEMLEQKRLQYAVRLPSERAKLHNVHIYAIVRVKVCDIEAKTHADAIQKAEALIDLNALFNIGSDQEFADDIDCFLVDEVGDEGHCNSRWYGKDGVTPMDQKQGETSVL